MNKSIFKLFLFNTFLFYSAITNSADSSSIGALSVTPVQRCVTALSQQIGGENVVYDKVRSIANGGLLCPGVYQAVSSCDVITYGGCGGDSCGWSVDVYTGSTHLASRSYIIGCLVTWGSGWGNVCENTRSTLVTNLFTFNTADHTQLRTTAWVEDYGVFACSIRVWQTSSYNGN